MQKTLVAIPARLKATRLPDKPLADIGGVPMIVHVWRRAMAAKLGRVIVATDSAEIAAVVRAAISEYLARHHRPADADAFGLWGLTARDGLDYQREVRAEW